MLFWIMCQFYKYNLALNKIIILFCAVLYIKRLSLAIYRIVTMFLHLSWMHLRHLILENSLIF